jgi:hypothetical protein
MALPDIIAADNNEKAAGSKTTGGTHGTFEAPLAEARPGARGDALYSDVGICGEMV